ncbi:MAG: 3-phosphoshikimate 1-carboxyvinyltransferase [Candidatus Marinimicrobia bacterium]|nr:3-phosphoshikimate 1-carboxyvinyltransferase [Candidatus Neomarinimicrobiota bacterium]
MTSPPPSAQVQVRPGAAWGGTITVPGDKSISHRTALLAALANGVSTLDGFLHSEDCLNTVRAVAALGAAVRTATDGRLEITGCGGHFQIPRTELDCGNSGTGLRLLMGLLAPQPFATRLIGDASLSRRPMRRIQTPLAHMGAEIMLTEPRGTPPVTVRGAPLQGIRYTLPVASAQVKSAILLAGLYARGVTEVIEPSPTRDHTERALSAAGFPLEIEGLRIRLTGAAGPPPLAARAWQIPGDFSSAAFAWVAAAIQPGASVTVRRVGLNPRRTALLDVLQRMGAQVRVTPEPTAPGAEPIGQVTVTGAPLRGTTIGGDEIPSLIDEIPVLSVAGLFAAGPTCIRDAAELRVKESDRIAVMAGHLRRLGATVDEQPDGFTLHGPITPRAEGVFASRGDHRVAMALAVAALRIPAGLRLTDVACISTSYPGFWDHWRQLGAYVEER